MKVSSTLNAADRDVSVTRTIVEMEHGKPKLNPQLAPISRIFLAKHTQDPQPRAGHAQFQSIRKLDYLSSSS